MYTTSSFFSSPNFLPKRRESSKCHLKKLDGTSNFLQAVKDV